MIGQYNKLSLFTSFLLLTVYIGRPNYGQDYISATTAGNYS